MAQFMKVRMRSKGRIVVPSAVRDAMGVGEGSILFARFEDGEFTLSTAHAVVRGVQKAVREYVPDDVSLVDELIADRRREAAGDDKGG